MKQIKMYMLKYGILSYLLYGLFFIIIINPKTIYIYRLTHLRALYESNSGENMVDAINYFDYGAQLFPGNKEINAHLIESKQHLEEALRKEEETLKEYRTEKH